jgi:hypothetical protein
MAPLCIKICNGGKAQRASSQAESAEMVFNRYWDVKDRDEDERLLTSAWIRSCETARRGNQ